MKVTIFCILLYCLLTPGFAQISPAIPTLAQTGQSLESFIPTHWQLLKRADDDLNKDGLSDTVAVIEYIQPQTETDEAPPRLLFIIFQQTQGYQLAMQSHKAILKSDEGGMMGDPFQKLTCQNGAVLFGLSGGSRERWAYDMRFRFQDNGWYLIGFTKSVLDSATGKGEIEDFNLLNGQMIVTTINGSKETAIKKQRPKKKLLNLNDFNAENIEELEY